MAEFLNRDQIRSGAIQEMALEASRLGLSTPMDPALFEASRQAIRENIGPGEPLWVFAYGSLIWNPAIQYDTCQAVRAYGWHRKFCLWTLLGRGCPDRPGLLLGLLSGGSCSGLAIRIPPECVESELKILWQREMPNGVYRPIWVSVQRADSAEKLRALTFAMRCDHPLFADRLDQDEVAQIIALAEGRLGRCRDYLYQTYQALQQIGYHDRSLDALYRKVRAIRATVDQHAR